jgi:hypothetical protein
MTTVFAAWLLLSSASSHTQGENVLDTIGMYGPFATQQACSATRQEKIDAGDKAIFLCLEGRSAQEPK